VRRQLPQAGRLGIAHHQAPDRLLVPDLFAGQDTGLAHRPEEPAFGDAGCLGYGVDAGLHPGRYGHGPDPASLSGHVRQHPAALPLFEIVYIDPEQLGPAQSAAEQQGRIARSRSPVRVPDEGYFCPTPRKGVRRQLSFPVNDN